MIEAHQLTKTLRREDRRRGSLLHRPPGDRHRLPRPQRGGEVDHDADDPRPGRSDVRPGDGQRSRLRPAPGAAGRVGALLEARAVHSGRSASDHLRVLAATTGIPRSRVDAVIDLVGLQDVASERAGAFSLGMGQRLGLASALLGDPQTLILDEPVNGLDPDGVLWIRELLKGLAQEGKTVFLSSHLRARWP